MDVSFLGSSSVSVSQARSFVEASQSAIWGHETFPTRVEQMSVSSASSAGLTHAGPCGFATSQTAKVMSISSSVRANMTRPHKPCTSLTESEMHLTCCGHASDLSRQFCTRFCDGFDIVETLVFFIFSLYIVHPETNECEKHLASETDNELVDCGRVHSWDKRAKNRVGTWATCSRFDSLFRAIEAGETIEA